MIISYIMRVIHVHGVLILISGNHISFCNISCFRSIGHDHKNRTLSKISEEVKFLNENNDQEMQKKCDTRDDDEHDQFWIAKNITDLMDHLLQGYDRRIRPFFESKQYLSYIFFFSQHYSIE